jgi:hypothetical protein
MKKIMLIICLLTFLSCGGNSDDILTQPEIETKVEVNLDTFQYNERNLSSYQKIKLPLNLIKGNNALWSNNSYITPVKGRYKITLKTKGKFYISRPTSVNDPCNILLKDYGISFWSRVINAGFGFGYIEKCNDLVYFEGSVERNLNIGDELSIDIALYTTKTGIVFVADINFEIKDCNVIIEKL